MIPEQMPIQAPKQITYPNVMIAIQELPDGGRALVVQAPGEILVFPMNAEAAQEIGRKLTAPHVIPATNGHPKL